MATATNTTADITDPRREGHRKYLLAAIGSPKAQRRFRRAGWPGIPAVQLPLRVTAALQELIAEGVVERIDVSGESNSVPGKQVTHTYYAMAATQ